MGKRTETAVVINGRQYCLTGYESEEYIQKVASYLNAKYGEIRDQKGYRNLENDMKEILMQINLADDYFKLKQQLVDTMDQMEDKDEELFTLKHDLMEERAKVEDLEKQIETLKIQKVEELEKQIETLKTQNLEEQKKALGLETQLNEYKKKTKR